MKKLADNYIKARRDIRKKRLEVLKQKISEYLIRENMNISRFERIADLPNHTIPRIFDDIITNPTIETILKIADALKCPIDELFDREVESDKP